MSGLSYSSLRIYEGKIEGVIKTETINGKTVQYIVLRGVEILGSKFDPIIDINDNEIGLMKRKIKND